MRPRRSLFGPLFLILLGVALLLNNLYPEISFADFFAVYWPWILIVWGGFRLIENIAATRSGGPAPQPIGAGGVLLALFLIVLGSSLHAARDRGGLFETIAARLDPDIADWAYQEYRSPVDTVRTSDPIESLILEHIPGRVRIVASANGEFEVEGSRTIRAVDQESADQQGADEEYSAEAGDGRFTISSKFGQRDFRGRIAYDLTVKVPGGRLPRILSRRTRLQVNGLSETVVIESDGGVLEIADMNGPVSVLSDDVRSLAAKRLNADFQLEGTGRGTELSDIAGAVTINGSFSRTIELSKLAGKFVYESKSVRLSAAQIPGEARIRSRSIEFSGALGPLLIHSDGVRNVKALGVEGPVEVRTEQGDIRIEPSGALAAVTAQTGRGAVELTVPAGAMFSANVSTGRGRVRQEFGGALEVKREGRGEHLSSSTGEGPLIQLHTDRGDIRLKRSGKADLPAEAPPGSEDPARL